MAEDHNFVKRASQFRPLRVLNSTYVNVSVRRLEREGRMRLANKYLAVELHRAFLGEIKEEIFKYNFGNFTDAEQTLVDADSFGIRGVTRKICDALQTEQRR